MIEDASLSMIIQSHLHAVGHTEDDRVGPGHSKNGQEPKTPGHWYQTTDANGRHKALGDLSRVRPLFILGSAEVAHYHGVGDDVVGQDEADREDKTQERQQTWCQEATEKQQKQTVN